MTKINNIATVGHERQCPAGYKNCDGYIIPNEWSVVRFSSLFKRLTRKNAENNQNVLTISAQQGLVSQMDYYNTLYASENKEGYSLLRKGDFSYNKSYSSDYAYGAIKRLDAYDSGIVSPLYICFTPQDGINSDFYLQYFEAGHFNREIYKIAQEGARNHGLLNVSTEDFFNSSLVFPPLAEQERIVEILMQCDKVIDLHRDRIKAYESLKKVYLKKLFPEKGESEPQLRFPGFSEQWTSRKLGDVVQIKDSARVPNSLWTKQGVPYLRSSDLLQNGLNGELFISKESYDMYALKTGAPEKGDVLFTSGGKVGISFEKLDDNPLYVQGGAVLYIKTSQSDILNGSFVNAFFETSRMKKYIDDTSVGGTIKHFTLMPANAAPISFPSYAEQQLIGEFFAHLNHTITLCRQELMSWQQKKKFLTQALLSGTIRADW